MSIARATKSLDRRLLRRQGLDPDAPSGSGEPARTSMVKAHSSVHVIANDTLVESPIVQAYVDTLLVSLETALKRLDLPIEVVETTPELDNTFWVNLIGRDIFPDKNVPVVYRQDEIRPTTSYIRNQASRSGEVILLLGVRRLESTNRSKSAKRYDNGSRLNRHNDIFGCLVFRPILELQTDEVWEFLSQSRPPWGGSHAELIHLYRNAAGGECPLVLDPDAAPSVAVLPFDLDAGHALWSKRIRRSGTQWRTALNTSSPWQTFETGSRCTAISPRNRMTQRRNGDEGRGPLTFAARSEVLDKLLQLQVKVGKELISEAEIRRAKEIWREDQAQLAIHRANRLLEMIGGNEEARTPAA